MERTAVVDVHEAELIQPDLHRSSGHLVGVLVAAVCTIAAVAARAIARRQSQLEMSVRDELRQGREEAAKASRELREELATGLGRAQGSPCCHNENYERFSEDRARNDFRTRAGVGRKYDHGA